MIHRVSPSSAPDAARPTARWRRVAVPLNLRLRSRNRQSVPRAAPRRSRGRACFISIYAAASKSDRAACVSLACPQIDRQRLVYPCRHPSQPACRIKSAPLQLILWPNRPDSCQDEMRRANSRGSAGVVGVPTSRVLYCCVAASVADRPFRVGRDRRGSASGRLRTRRSGRPQTCGRRPRRSPRGAAAPARGTRRRLRRR